MGTFPAQYETATLCHTSFLSEVYSIQIRWLFPKGSTDTSSTVQNPVAIKLHSRSLTSRFIGDSGEMKNTCSLVKGPISVVWVNICNIFQFLFTRKVSRNLYPQIIHICGGWWIVNFSWPLYPWCGNLLGTNILAPSKDQSLLIAKFHAVASTHLHTWGCKLMILEAGKYIKEPASSEGLLAVT